MRKKKVAQRSVFDHAFDLLITISKQALKFLSCQEKLSKKSRPVGKMIATVWPR